MTLRLPKERRRKTGAVGGTRTHDRRFRKPMLYPVELPPLVSVWTATDAPRYRQAENHA
jgi:hypothetical protein